METIKIKIQGMSCSHCEMRVSNAIKSIQGVELLTIDLQSAEVKIQNTQQEEAIIAAVKAIGYAVTEIQHA